MSWEFLFDRVVAGLLVAQTILILWNRRVVRRPQPISGTSGLTVSVLVPARTEEEWIGRCIESLLAQDHVDLEVIVLDDESEDATADIVRSFDDPRLTLVLGEPTPSEWTGKNWACHQLSKLATGDLLCFVDADTVLAPDTISSAVGALVSEGAGLVSLLPRTGRTSLTGQTVLPMISHATFGLFPVAAIHSDRWPTIAAAFGPFMLLTRDAYTAAGGHAARPRTVVDDVDLARGVKRAGRSLRLCDGTDLIETAWYRTVPEIWTGFSKNAYPALDYNIWVASAAMFLLAPLLLSPAVRVVLGILDGEVSTFAAWLLLILVINRALTAIFGRDALWSTPLHPFTVAFWGATLGWSIVLANTEREVVWKGRTISTSAEDLA